MGKPSFCGINLPRTLWMKYCVELDHCTAPCRYLINNFGYILDKGNSLICMLQNAKHEQRMSIFHQMGGKNRAKLYSGIALQLFKYLLEDISTITHFFTCKKNMSVNCSDSFKVTRYTSGRTGRRLRCPECLVGDLCFKQS